MDLLAEALSEAGTFDVRAGLTAAHDFEMNTRKMVMAAFGRVYAERMGNYNGITFYGDGSEKSRTENVIKGFTIRLNEFIKEAPYLPIRSDFKPEDWR